MQTIIFYIFNATEILVKFYFPSSFSFHLFTKVLFPCSTIIISLSDVYLYVLSSSAFTCMYFTGAAPPCRPSSLFKYWTTQNSFFWDKFYFRSSKINWPAPPVQHHHLSSLLNNTEFLLFGQILLFFSFLQNQLQKLMDGFASVKLTTCHAYIGLSSCIYHLLFI